MQYPIYDLTIMPMLRMLKNLDDIVREAETYQMADTNIEESTIVQARLFPNMKPFVFQIQAATDTAKGAAARLAGKSVPAWSDNEKTFAELHERLNKAISYLSEFEASDFASADEREIELKPAPDSYKLIGKDYISWFAMPNFYFHATTAYNILRANGVDVGKGSYLGKV